MILFQFYFTRNHDLSKHIRGWSAFDSKTTLCSSRFAIKFEKNIFSDQVCAATVCRCGE